MLTVTDLAKQYGGQVLFTDVNLQFHAGHRYGIVGANGSGKSTFLRILTGEESASAGEVVIPKRARVGVLEQDHFAYDDVPILHVVMMGHAEVWRAMAEKEAMLSGPEEDFDVDRYGDLEETILRLDGYALEAKAAEARGAIRESSDNLRQVESDFEAFKALRATQNPPAGAKDPAPAMTPAYDDVDF